MMQKMTTLAYWFSQPMTEGALERAVSRGIGAACSGWVLFLILFLLKGNSDARNQILVRKQKTILADCVRVNYA